LEGAASTHVLAAAVIEAVRITEERSCAGDGDVSIHVRVHTENHSVLGFVVATRIKITYWKGVGIAIERGLGR
jgi:hypothetical protein